MDWHNILVIGIGVVIVCVVIILLLIFRTYKSLFHTNDLYYIYKYNIFDYIKDLYHIYKYKHHMNDCYQIYKHNKYRYYKIRFSGSEYKIAIDIIKEYMAKHTSHYTIYDINIYTEDCAVELKSFIDKSLAKDIETILTNLGLDIIYRYRLEEGDE